MKFKRRDQAHDILAFVVCGSFMHAVLCKVDHHTSATAEKHIVCVTKGY